MVAELMDRVEEISKEMNDLIFQYKEDSSNIVVLCRIGELSMAASDALEILSKI